MKYNLQDIYRHLSPLDTICYALNDEHVETIADRDGLRLVKDYLQDGTPVWRLPREGEHLEDEI